MDTNVIVVGAGIAGLACARRLADAGRSVVVLEKSRGLGGRCATRRVQGQPVDHGLPFYHGSEPGFLDALRASADADDLVPGWPSRLHGSGRPCQSRLFREDETRLAFRRGMTSFPKRLAEGLDVRLETRVGGVSIEGERVRVDTGGGEPLTAGALVLALPTPQARALLDTLDREPRELASFARVLEMTGTVSCLTAFAGYPRSAPAPDWDLCHPDGSDILQMCSHDSTKRAEPERHVLVFHAYPAWSRDRLEQPAEVWRDELLAEAARLLGDWVKRPDWVETHRWRYGRADPGPDFKRPLFLQADGRPTFGIAGENFAPGGGVQAAWLSGRQIADRILGEPS